MHFSSDCVTRSCAQITAFKMKTFRLKDSLDFCDALRGCDYGWMSAVEGQTGIIILSGLFKHCNKPRRRRSDQYTFRTALKCYTVKVPHSWTATLCAGGTSMHLPSPRLRLHCHLHQAILQIPLPRRRPREQAQVHLPAPLPIR